MGAHRLEGRRHNRRGFASSVRNETNVVYDLAVGSAQLASIGGKRHFEFAFKAGLLY